MQWPLHGQVFHALQAKPYQHFHVPAKCRLCPPTNHQQRTPMWNCVSPGENVQGMVQAWVAQKLAKSNMLCVFFMCETDFVMLHFA